MKDELFTMFNLQDKLNTMINPNWKKERTVSDWRTAIFVETGELIESLPWKWWKYEDSIDTNNLLIEIVDIWHFGISAILNTLESEEQYRIGIEDFIKTSNYSRFKQNKLNNIPELIKETITEITYLSNYLLYIDNEQKYASVTYVLTRLLNLTTLYGYTFEDVYKIYIMKNVLNIFRQNFGYNTGTYKKIWNGVEDNQVASEILKELETENIPASKLPDELYIRLEKRYNEVQNI